MNLQMVLPESVIIAVTNGNLEDLRQEFEAGHFNINALGKWLAKEAPDTYFSNYKKIGQVEGTALCRAAEQGQIQCCIYLISCGADVNLADSSNRTPLFFAVLHSRLDVVSFLCEQTTTDVLLADVRRSTPLHIAATIKSSDKMMKALTLHPSCTTVIVKNIDNSTPLHLAVMRYSDAVQVLTQHTSCDVEASDIQSFTPLHYAVSNCGIEIVRILVNHRTFTSVNILHKGMRTQLCMAIDAHSC